MHAQASGRQIRGRFLFRSANAISRSIARTAAQPIACGPAFPRAGQGKIPLRRRTIPAGAGMWGSSSARPWPVRCSGSPTLLALNSDRFTALGVELSGFCNEAGSPAVATRLKPFAGAREKSGKSTLPVCGGTLASAKFASPV